MTPLGRSDFVALGLKTAPPSLISDPGASCYKVCVKVFLHQGVCVFLFRLIKTAQKQILHFETVSFFKTAKFLLLFFRTVFTSLNAALCLRF